MGLLGKALLGAVKGSAFFLQHGGCESFYAGIDKLSQAASQAALKKAEEASRKNNVADEE